MLMLMLTVFLNKMEDKKAQEGAHIYKFLMPNPETLNTTNS